MVEFLAMVDRSGLGWIFGYIHTFEGVGLVIVEFRCDELARLESSPLGIAIAVLFGPSGP